MTFFRKPGENSDLDGARALRNGVILGGALWLVMGVACAAFAQNTTANAGAQSGSNAGAEAGAASQSGASITQNYYSGGTTRIENAGRVGQDVTYGGGTSNVQRNIIEGGTSDRYRATIRNTPDAYAPNVSGGTNSCLVGMSGAGSVAGFGIGLGGNWSDPECERRQLAALLHNTGQQDIAQEVLCDTNTVRQARARMGRPCAVDVARQQVAAASPAVVMTPAPVASPPVQVIGGGARPSANQVPDWCLTASPQERRQYRAACSGLTGIR